MTFDWSTSGRKDYPHYLHWIFFDADTEQEILPVKTGYRLTVLYHIFRVSSPCIWQDSDPDDIEDDNANLTLQFKLTPLFSTLISSYKDPKFLPNGGRIAFGLNHKYDLAGVFEGVLRDDCYKGKDAVLVSTLKAMGLSYQFKGSL